MSRYNPTSGAVGLWKMRHKGRYVSRPATGHVDTASGVYVPGTLNELRELIETWREWGLEQMPEYAAWTARVNELRREAA